THGSGELQVTAPETGNIAPPGWYLLFIVAYIDGHPVPSKGQFVQLPTLTGARGVPSLIQSGFGHRGNLEFVTPIAGGGMDHWFRDNDGSFFWTFGTRFG